MADEQKKPLDQLEELMNTGSEADVKQFILDHMQEFPAEAQREFAVGLFEDAITEQADAAEKIVQDREIARRGDRTGVSGSCLIPSPFPSSLVDASAACP